MRKVNELTIESLEEISGVDRPAQPGARCVIFKRQHPSTGAGGGDTLPPNTNTPGDAEGNQEPTKMTKQNEPAEQLADVTKKLELVTSELAVAKAVAEFSDSEKAIYKSMDAAGQEAFRALSPEQRVAKATELAKSDAVVYTTLDGETFRKSDDPRLIAIAKRADEHARALVTERFARSTDQLRKRAETEIPKLPGEEIAKVALLRAVDGISDEPVRKSILEMLKAGNDAIGKSFRAVGTESGAGESDAEQAHEKLEGIAKSLREKNPKLSFEDAYVLAAEQNPTIYEEALGAALPEEN